MNESDINELAQAKGANVAGLHVVFNQFGIRYEDIDVFYLAGGFGRNLDIDIFQENRFDSKHTKSQRLFRWVTQPLKVHVLRYCLVSKRLELENLVKKAVIADSKHIRIFSITSSKGANSIPSNPRARCNRFPDMLELFETNPKVNVQESEYQRLLGLPKNYSMKARIRELADAARQWYADNGRPWF